MQNQLEKKFASKVRKRGRKYYEDGAVDLVYVDDESVEATVAGTRPYLVDLVLQDGEVIGAACDCPFARNTSCKHMWAAILSYMAQKKFAPPKASESSGANWMNGLSLVAPQSAPPHDDDDAAEQADNRQISYVISIDSADSEGVSVQVFSSQRLKSGKFGKPSGFDFAPWQISVLPESANKRVLKELVVRIDRYSYGRPPNEVRLTGIGVRLLHDIAATGRLFWRLAASQRKVEDWHPVRNQSDGQWKLHVDFSKDKKKKQWVINGEFRSLAESSDQQSLPLSSALVSLPDGIILTKDCLLKLEDSAESPWLKPLMAAGPLTVPFTDLKPFVDFLSKTPQLCQVKLPDELIKIEDELPACIPKLQFTADNKLPERLQRMRFLFATLSFDYENGNFLKSDPAALMLTDKKAKSWCRRNFELESEFSRTLKELGAQPLLQSLPDCDANIKVPESGFAELVRTLADRGWTVEAENARFRPPGSFKFSVSSGIDWFDLYSEVDYGKVSASLPELLAAAKSGNNFVELSDGSRGLLPEEWLKQYAHMAQVGEVSDDSIRFGPSQAMMLDAFLQEQEETTTDRDFTSFCKQLKKIDGVKPANPGRSFQGELRDYQKEGLGWLKFLQQCRLGGCLADDMGLGKTVQVLAMLDARRSRRLKKDEERKQSLIVVPKSLIFNWIDEAARFTPKLKVLNYTGLDRNDRWKEEFADSHAVITTYATMRNDIARLKDLHFDYAVLDEAQAIKTQSSLTAKASRLLKADHRLAMTGTPVENHLGELWSLFEFLNPKMLGSSKNFKSLMAGLRDEREHQQSLQMLSTGLKPFMLRRTKKQVLTELPDKTEQTIFCEMKPKQQKLYDELKAHYRAHLSNKVKELGLKKAKIHVLEALLRLRQAACHPGLIDEAKAKLPSAKLDAVVEQVVQLAADGHKALVFSQFTTLLALLKKRLDKEGLTYEYLDGKTTKRQDHVQRFQTDESCPLFLISLKAGGHGLNLTAADYVFILDPWWNPAVEAQAVDRAHRMGQKQHVFAYRMICKGTVEERILEMQKSKKKLADAIISEDSGLLKSLTNDDIQMLLT